MGIQILSESAVRAVGAGQVIAGPVAIVKELIDNALDAQATSVSVQVSSDTLGSIEVRDNGHGIPSMDHAMVAKRYCTSKISNQDDVRAIGGSPLGFRGEALASIAELSGSLMISTRCVGEHTAVVLSINRYGQVSRTEHAPLPVGTAVRVTNIFTELPVRKKAALQDVGKHLMAIRRLLHSYCLARSGVRLSFRVLNTKSEKDDFIYAPMATPDAEDAAFKLFGTACASQCTKSTYHEQGYHLQAYLPRSDADPSRISSFGPFISVDTRPLSAMRSISKQIYKLFREALNRLHNNLSGVRDPFLFLEIGCPTGSYDVNVEPTKNDVLFKEGDAVVEIVRKLFETTYNSVQNASSECSSLVAVPITPSNVDSDEILLEHERCDPVQNEIDCGQALLNESDKSSALFNPWTLAKLHASQRVKEQPGFILHTASMRDTLRLSSRQHCDRSQTYEPKRVPARGLPAPQSSAQSSTETLRQLGKINSCSVRSDELRNDSYLSSLMPTPKLRSNTVLRSTDSAAAESNLQQSTFTRSSMIDYNHTNSTRGTSLADIPSINCRPRQRLKRTHSPARSGDGPTLKMKSQRASGRSRVDPPRRGNTNRLLPSAGQTHMPGPGLDLQESPAHSSGENSQETSLTTGCYDIRDFVDQVISEKPVSDESLQAPRPPPRCVLDSDVFPSGSKKTADFMRCWDPENRNFSPGDGIAAFETHCGHLHGTVPQNCGKSGAGRPGASGAFSANDPLQQQNGRHADVQQKIERLSSTRHSGAPGCNHVQKLQLPLEHTPAEYLMQDVVHRLTTSVAAISRQVSELKVERVQLQFGESIRHQFQTFASKSLNLPLLAKRLQALLTQVYPESETLAAEGLTEGLEHMFSSRHAKPVCDIDDTPDVRRRASPP